jgi:hypothetical protein
VLVAPGRLRGGDVRLLQVVAVGVFQPVFDGLARLDDAAVVGDRPLRELRRVEVEVRLPDDVLGRVVALPVGTLQIRGAGQPRRLLADPYVATPAVLDVRLSYKSLSLRD